MDTATSPLGPDQLAGLVLGTLALSLAMLWAWARQRRTRNAAIVDLVWAGGVGALGVLHAGLADGWAPRRALIAVLAGTWSLRLALHLRDRVGAGDEDGRYAELRERLGARFDRFAFLFFQAQALLAGLLSVAFLVPAASSLEGWRTVDALAVALFLVSVSGEALADRQLSAWRADPEHRRFTCRAGLWRYSRHPNYFFEWLHWCVYPVLSIGLALGWTVWLAPALMLLLVLRVTGIPPTERHALESRGEDYRRYQETTNAFFPGPPRAPRTPLEVTSQ